MSTRMDVPTLRVIAAECGQSALYSLIEDTPADIWADRKLAVIRIGFRAIIEVRRVAHSNYQQVYSLGDFTNEHDQVALCKKVIQYVRKHARKQHHHRR